MSNPPISVVIPCYNMGSALNESVESVRMQTYPNIELIIVDDGSTDHATLKILDQLEHRGVRVIHQTNGGVGNALNRGMTVASGEFFTALGDDLIEPPYLEEAVRAMQADPKLGIVYCQADLFGAINGPWLLPTFSMKRQLINNCIFATALFRRSDWMEAGGYDEEMVGREDHDFIMRILSLGRTVYRLPGLYFHYRRPAVNSSVNDRVGASRQALVEAHAAIMRNNLPLYGKHADLLFESYFDLIDEVNDLRNRYSALERLRQRPSGQRLLAVAKMFRGRLRARASGPRGGGVRV